MRAMTIGLLAAVGIAIVLPAHAEDAYVGVGPVGVGVGVRDHDRDCRTTVIHEEGMTKRIKRCRD
jgi:hypothetical protein